MVSLVRPVTVVCHAGCGALLRGAGLGALLVAAFAAQPYRLAFNATSSEPKGIYLTRRLAPTSPVYRGELVVMRYAGPSVVRYRAVAPYAAGTEFLKYIAGVPGDVLYTAGKNVLLVRDDDQRAVSLGARLARSPSGRPVPPGPTWGGTRIPRGEYYLTSDGYRDAYDSRYFGLVPRNRLLARAWPLWTVTEQAPVSAESRDRR